MLRLNEELGFKKLIFLIHLSTLSDSHQMPQTKMLTVSIEKWRRSDDPSEGIIQMEVIAASRNSRLF